jgi:Protein of unknown function (DUF3224)
MTAHADSTFTVKSWDEQTYQEIDGDAKLTRASIVQSFEGDLDAEGAAELLMSYAADGTATIVGLQRFTGTLGGKEGSFVLQSVGGFDGAEATASLRVVPGSGTGALAGLSGTGASAVAKEPPGTLTLEYDLS